LKRSLFAALLVIFPFSVFAQQGAAALRDYIGLINQSYHPGIVSYFEKAKKEYEKQGESNSAKIIDLILKGAFGSGFLYSDRGNFYVITNNHVVAQAHTVSITFERQDETKIRIDNLRIIAADEETDLAILAFPADQKPPVTQGLTLLSRAVEEGEDVFSAGFPGLGMTPIWQFGRGMISNASVRFPKNINDETMMGPFIQHTAQVDDGNSGGPLLVIQRGVPSGYSVAGVNTLSGARRQAANYSVPVSTLQNFINNSLNPRPQEYRAALDERLKKFIEGLSVNQAVFPHINSFLSSECVGENVEYAFEEMRAKAPRTVIRTFIDHSREDIIGAMGLAVAWTIENSIRSSGAVKAEIKEITGEDEEYTVVFTINGKDVSSVWIREYGNWRIKSFGKAASGDHTLIQKRINERIIPENLHVNNVLYIELGLALCPDKPAALYASLDIAGAAVNLFYSADSFWNAGFAYSLHIPIPLGNLGVMPNFKFGAGVTRYMEDETADILRGFSTLFQIGMKFTTSYAPGLFAGASFQYNLNIFDIMSGGDSTGRKNPFRTGFIFSAGYAF